MFDVLQLIGGTILSVGYIPQIVQIIRTKSAKDFNLKTFVMIVVGISCMEAYAVQLVIQGIGLMYFITNTFNLIVVFVLLVSVIRYSRPPASKKPAAINKINIT